MTSGAPAFADEKPAAPPAAPAPDGKPADAPPAKPAPTPIDPKNVALPGKAASARQCVESIFVYAEKSDLEKAFSFMVEPDRTYMPKVIGARRAAKSADDKLTAAMEAKWGPGAAADVPMVPMPTKFVEGSYGIVSATEDGDKATVVAREITPKNPKAGARDETFECVKTDGYWFASPPKNQPSRRRVVSPEEEVKMADAMTSAMHAASDDVAALADEVTAGKIAAKEDVKAKYVSIQLAMRQALMKGGMGAAPKPPPKTPPTSPEAEKPAPK